MTNARNNEPRPPYVPPKVTQVSEAEMLRSFQITSAAASWWGM